MATIARKAPCPCGSGKKYKHCCWAKDHPDELPRGEAPVGGKGGAKKLLVLFPASAAIGILIGVLTDSFEKGFAIGLALAFGSVLYWILHKPPPSQGNDPSPTLRFGR